MKKYALKGINEDETVCSICGKVELQRVMWIVELDKDRNEISEPFACGTTCGAKMLGYNISRVQISVKNFKASVESKRYNLRISKENQLGRSEILDQLAGLNWKERTQHPLWAKLQEITEDAIVWANNQTILIDL